MVDRGGTGVEQMRREAVSLLEDPQWHQCMAFSTPLAECDSARYRTHNSLLLDRRNFSLQLSTFDADLAEVFRC